MYSGNSFLTSYGINWYPVIREVIHGGRIYFIPREYNQSTCNCATSPKCAEPATLELDSGESWPVPGMFIGCTPLEFMLQSTLECLYSQACLNIISEIFPNSQYFPALISNRTRFHPINTTKVESIMAERFIEQWSINISFEGYFNACRPNTCTYTFTTRFNILYVFNTVLSIYGGLNIVLKIVVPFTVGIIYKYLLKRNNRVAPANAT
ncbi:unnamed protein product [Rotaria sordida]|uniref:Uncharacterized protein n=1 Tax=Rotaria sordida TaxID=392033 RepID=A0A819W5I1_9BILA|nr:unnamed protein product [Rotaria sordida]